MDISTVSAAFRSTSEEGASDSLRSIVRSELSEMLEKGEQLRALRHPLGFVYFPFLRQGEVSLRLHVWVSGRYSSQLLTSPIHAHAWNLSSYVLCGKLANILVSTRTAQDAPHYQVFEVEGDGTLDNLSPTGEMVRAVEYRRDSFKEGQLYSMKAGIYHRTKIETAAITATLVLVRRIPGRGERVLGPIDMGNRQMGRSLIASREVVEVASAVLREVGVS